MRRLLALSLLLTTCKDNGNCNSNTKQNYHTGALCASDGSCPPGQMCTTGNICYATCTMPGLSSTMMNSCCECCPYSGSSGNGAFCDLDFFCKPGCNPAGGGGPGCAQGTCSAGQVCDTSYNICRAPCSVSGGTGCPSGQECVTDPNNNSCTFCRPVGGTGTFGHACNSNGSCSGGGLTCDPETHTCQYLCGNGGMSCGPFGNCPSNFGCDPMKNICRPLCQGGSCPQGGTCMTPSQSTCAICIPSGLPDGGNPNTPTTLATTPGANHIAIDSSNVFWTTGTDVRRCAISGCNNAPTQVAVGGNPVGITVSINTVYWNNDGNSIFSCPSQGTCGSSSPIGQVNEPGGGAIAVGNGNILWSTGSHVYQCPLAGCSATPNAILQPGSTVEWISWNPTNLNFYLGDGANLLTYGTGIVNTSMNAGAIIGIAAQGNEVFWTNTSGNVLSCTVSGCGGNPTIIASARSGLLGIAVDASNVYWVESSAGQIMKCPRSGCTGAPTPVVTGQNRPIDVAVDNTNLYWTNKGDGTVKKMAK